MEGHQRALYGVEAVEGSPGACTGSTANSNTGCRFTPTNIKTQLSVAGVVGVPEPLRGRFGHGIERPAGWLVRAAAGDAPSRFMFRVGSSESRNWQA